MSKQETANWDIPESDLATHDPLLACLLFLTKYYQTPCSAISLTERLPLVDNKLTPTLFVRAAERAKLSAEINKIAFKDVTDLVLPAVLLLQDGEACLLLEKREDESVILTHKTGQGRVTVPNTTLAEKYGGYAIFVKPAYQFTRPSKESYVKKKPKDWFWTVLMKSWPIYVEVLTASVLINLFALAVPLFAMNVYDRVVPNHAIETMWVLATGIGLVFLFDLFLKSLRAYFIDVAGKKTDVQLSAIIFEHILGIQMNARPSSVGAFANTIQSFEAFRDFITSTTITVLVDLPFVILYLIVLFYLGGNLVIIPLVVVPIVFLIGFLLQYPLTKITKTSYQLAQEKNATLIESLAGIEAIKSSGAEGTMQRRFEQAVIYAARLGAKLRFLVNSSINLTVLAQQLANVLLVIFGVYKIIAGELTVGALIACTILGSRALAPMGQVAAIFSRYYQSMQALESIGQVMKLPTDVQDASSYLHRPHIEGNIELRQVDFHYPGQTNPILNHVSFSIKKGERVAIIGRIGSGKSTIAKLLMGLYRPDKGGIYMDGTDYLQINPADLRRQIGYVPQDVVLFYGTVKDNIRLGAPYIDDDRILKAAAIAGVTNFTQNHPEGLDRQVGERGSRLSAGQRQAIAVARALLLSPKILIFDEPTASMDDGSETQLRQNLKKYLSDDVTFILVTHKAAMLELVDRLIVIDNNRVVADGPKETVLNALRSGVKFDSGKKQADAKA
ncbi:type I secretion system permease/ATPase [Legionella septentrionalis]|uniref:Type I secretion system permease/ATPase n=1 Tax=Legionella septentrionalis TaxID=2498109 RepID=A0A3S0XHM0_9GAMM|nr:type I secretion system permease/ATPase [Legionella septentrionalis]RUQ90721.1 type I secretion system permease/ATPase [Legionella septentrionalis]RUQ99974.1 type I secretion system permease/ATPase [Legionella septentrionalis]RUR10181.1 type I secretion system permease/ATPase [Legionella septentrionalis]RUR15807.1 type I secretion system permease/ATPase [Legionella septentrionalis]